MQPQKGQGALEYLLLIGGAVVVAVIVIYIMIGLAGTTGNAANTTIQTGLQHIQGVLGDGGGGQQASLCGNGEVDIGEVCDGLKLGGESCITRGYVGGGALGCSADCLSFDTSDCT